MTRGFGGLWEQSSQPGGVLWSTMIIGSNHDPPFL